MSLQQDEATVLLDEVVSVFTEKIALSHLRSAATKKRNDATQPDTDGVAGSKETHLVFIGLQYTVPPVDT